MLDPVASHSLSSATHLGAYHTARERFYTVAARLLAAPPDERMLATARGMLARSTVSPDLVAALGDPRALGAAGEHAQLVARGVLAPAPIPGPASAAGADLVTELRGLAILAEGIADAIQAGDMLGAAALSDEQARVIDQYAGQSVADHARRLAAASGPFYRAVADAVAVQIADDVRLLATDVGGGAGA
jgi:hypothetical protein